MRAEEQDVLLPWSFVFVFKEATSSLCIKLHFKRNNDLIPVAICLSSKYMIKRAMTISANTMPLLNECIYRLLTLQ